MCFRVFLLLIGAVYICCQVLATGDVYIAELMVESNVTLDAQTVISVLNDLQVTVNSGGSYTVTLLKNELVAECLIVGDDHSCNCSVGYIWSNEVCYTAGCCSDSTCKQNVSYMTPLCIAKVNVRMNGSVILTTGSFTPGDAAQTTPIADAFKTLNGFESLNVTGYRQSDTIADFKAAVSVKFETSTLQKVVTQLETSLSAVVWVDTQGMVTIESPGVTVCYKSSPQLKCTFEEATDRAGWNLTRKNDRFELNTGSVVNLDTSCATPEYKSCAIVNLKEVTGMWAGTYECGFTRGSVRHTANRKMSVALLPDVITMKISPLTADCTTTDNVEVHVTATIPASTETYNVSWTTVNGEVSKQSISHTLDYSAVATIACQKTPDARYIEVTFTNVKSQTKSARVDIPVIYDGDKFCSEEEVNGENWPKTPDGDTAINRTCPQGRVGYKSRTCEGATWLRVVSNCVSEELNKVLNAADLFQQGLGATQEVALDIFEGLKNSSAVNSDSSDTVADIGASINVLGVMASASQKVVLGDSVFPDFIGSASNMLNKSWSSANTSTMHSMSSNYLVSVEDLVKNIRVNMSRQEPGIISQNVDLKFCTDRDCNVSVFDVSVNLNKSTGIMKTFAVKNLMDKLKNNYGEMITTPLIVSTTLENSSDSSLEIAMDFPIERLNPNKPFCVFWNTKEKQWSSEGCTLKSRDDNRTVCTCNHLTSFSVLMSKRDISTDILDMITHVGLGVSISCLMVFLIIEYLVWSAVVKTNLSHFRHTALVNIAVFLLLADCSFLASSSPETLGDTWCLVLTVCKHLFYLAMFSWMLSMSVMLVHQLIFVFNPLRKRVFMFLSSIVGYVCPILIVGSSYVYCKYTKKPYYNKKTCWLVFERILEGSMHAFLLPVGTIVLTNLFSMVVVIVTLMKSSVPDGSKADKETAKSILKVVVFLTPVFGVTWIIGFFQLMLDETHPMQTVAVYSFTILNSFQGFFILLTGCFAEQKVREELVKLIKAKSKGNSDSTKNLTSTTYTKDK
ncbi:adhesion G-protein coupled receptor F3 isoform X2 [Toxotes jaculatrix]|uniref:adhesion G-protein coupled receptor F3 isoform X2 n=1 Tax=Toxotes jaculatrix TaxID=941984 RepID=UPI001B3AC181|nr:adhesion G-protein coupled receptor F3 isoform X2 [Toxotes jaculatrix]